jgi:Predicted 3'-5' exonuclease related to the exonuclease domain of PolB
MAVEGTQVASDTRAVRSGVCAGENIVVLDLETARSADDCLYCGAALEGHARGVYGHYHVHEPIGWDRKVDLGLSIGCYYDYADDRLHWFDRATLEATVRCLTSRQPLLVSFNGIGFDFPLMRGLLRRDAEQYATPGTDLPALCDQFEVLCAYSYDILAAIWRADPARKFERGLNSLGVISVANGYGTTELDGALAPRLWAQGRYAEVLNYCAGDVDKTRRLFEQILATGQILRGDGRPLGLPPPVMLVPAAWDVEG